MVQWLHHSRPTGTAARLRDALAFERELGLNYWEAEVPVFRGVHLTFSQEVRNPLLTLKGRASADGQAIDLRLQSHRWFNEFEQRGGQLFKDQIGHKLGRSQAEIMPNLIPLPPLNRSHLATRDWRLGTGGDRFPVSSSPSEK